MRKKLNEAELFYINSFAGKESLEEIARKLNCKPSAIKKMYEEAVENNKVKVTGISYPVNGVVMMTGSASKLGDEHKNSFKPELSGLENDVHKFTPKF